MIDNRRKNHIGVLNNQEQYRLDEAIQTRRDFLSGLTTAAGILSVGCSAGGKSREADRSAEPRGPADVTLRIGPVLADIAEDHTITTIGYNGSVPGPVIRFQEGVPVTVDLFNDTDILEYVHWHGMTLPAALDGAEEEGSLAVPAHGHIRYRLTPEPSGARFVHTHAMSMHDLYRGTFTGQYAFTYIEPRINPGHYDQEIFLSTHEWEPYFTTEEEEPSETEPPAEPHEMGEEPAEWEVGYHRYTINGKCLGHGEPIRVKEGQRVLFHLLNASATENIKLALPGHSFQVVALDGNPVPRPTRVDLLRLGTAERIDAVVEMNNPGVWILGSPKDADRGKGMGIVIEYANRTGVPRWIKPATKAWDYTLFGEASGTSVPAEVIPLLFGQTAGSGGFAHWTINGKAYRDGDQPRVLTRGKRYRLVFDNQTHDEHPVHLHRNSFELTNVGGKPTQGVWKDVVLVNAFQKIAADFTPAVEGLTLFHCHQQIHMGCGFRMLFNVL